VTAPFVPWASTRLARPAGSVAEVASASLGLYATPPVSHLELAARLAGYKPRQLEKAYADKKVVGLRALRGSAFLLPKEVVGIAVSATRERRIPVFASYLDRALVDLSYDKWAARIERLLSDGVPRGVAQIKTELVPSEGDERAISYVVGQMATECRIVGTGTAVSWRAGANQYVLWNDWLPDVDPFRDAAEAQIELAARYLAAWGPATADDFAWWAGLTKTEATAALSECATPDRKGWFSTDETVEAKPPKGVRLLPWWDTLFVTWKDRSRFIPEDVRPFVYDRDGNATSVVLVDGVVAGVWNLGTGDRDLEVSAAPFDTFTPRQWRLIEEEAEMIRTVAGAKSVEVVRMEHPPNLLEGRRNLFLRPLTG
jgi:hypothetical protein